MERELKSFLTSCLMQMRENEEDLTSTTNNNGVKGGQSHSQIIHPPKILRTNENHLVCFLSELLTMEVTMKESTMPIINGGLLLLQPVVAVPAFKHTQRPGL